MYNILANILGLDQYLKIQEENVELLRPSVCPHCKKAGLWCHGVYERKSSRTSGNHDLVCVFRFFCPHCHRTCSTLPEYMSPRRWYLWDVQQMAMALFFAGKSLTAIAKTIAPSRHTISRWLGRLKERFKLHKDTLCQHFMDLGRTDDFVGFWSACFRKISLSQAMYFCNVAGVNIP